MPVSTGANANINIRVDNEIKNKAQDLFAALGLDMTSAINICLAVLQYHERGKREKRLRLPKKL